MCLPNSCDVKLWLLVMCCCCFFAGSAFDQSDCEIKKKQLNGEVWCDPTAYENANQISRIKIGKHNSVEAVAKLSHHWN